MIVSCQYSACALRSLGSLIVLVVNTVLAASNLIGSWIVLVVNTVLALSNLMAA